MTDDDDVLYEQDGHVVVLTLNRPERMNAMGGRMGEQLDAAWERIAADPSVRALVITGAGDRAFCAGADMAEAAERGGVTAGLDVPERAVDAMRFSPMRHGIWLPVIVAVNGVCAGGGLHFVGDADVVVASDRASFVDPHVAVGQVSALEPISLLPRIGLGNTLRLVVLGTSGRLSAVEALRISLIDEIVPHEQLRGRALELAHAAAAGSPAAIEASKRAVWAAVESPFQEALQYGWDLLRKHWEHPDNVEGPTAFMEKRQPNWQV